MDVIQLKPPYRLQDIVGTTDSFMLRRFQKVASALLIHFSLH